MNARKLVEEDMKEFICKALKNGVLLNPRIGGSFYNDRYKISSKYTRFLDEEDYLERYYKQYEAGEYLAVFFDGAFLQINYEFSVISKNVSHLAKMNLCFLPPVEDGKIIKEYIRIDFTDSAENSFFHPFAHLHIGFRNYIRIPLEEVTIFSEFMRIVLYLFYPKEFQILYGETYKTTNTRNTNILGKLTKHRVLTSELENNCYLRIS